MEAYCSSSARPSSDSLQIMYLGLTQSPTPSPILATTLSLSMHFFSHKGAMRNCFWKLQMLSWSWTQILGLICSVLPCRKPLRRKATLTFHLWTTSLSLILMLTAMSRVLYKRYVYLLSSSPVGLHSSVYFSTHILGFVKLMLWHHKLWQLITLIFKICGHNYL